MSGLLTQGPAARGRPLPRAILAGAAALVAFALAATSVGRITGVGRLEMPQERVVETLALRFEDRDDGAVLVRDARDGRTHLHRRAGHQRLHPRDGARPRAGAQAVGNRR